MKLDVSLTEFFAAPPEEVWESLTNAEVLADWLMPNDFVPEIGRAFTLVPDHPTPWEGNVECTVLQLLSRKRMVWSWKTRGMKEPSRVEFELLPRRGGTELHFRHTGEARAPVAKGTGGGWPDMLDRLVSTLQRRRRPETSTLSIAATLSAPPDDVFEILLDARRHSALTKSESRIDGRVGGRFTYLDGRISGVFEALEPPRRIVQSLRSAEWPGDHHARVSYDLTPLPDAQRTHVTVLEESLPTSDLDSVVSGWQEYWEAFAGLVREERVGVVRRFVEEYKNRQNPDIVDDLVAGDCAVHIPLPGLPQGREGMRLNGRLMCGAFPDVHVVREFLVAEGDIVVERATATATHRGELIGTPPTGRPVTWTELHAYRVRGGRITEVWSEADFMGVMVQVGAVRLPGG